MKVANLLFLRVCDAPITSFSRRTGFLPAAQSSHIHFVAPAILYGGIVLKFPHLQTANIAILLKEAAQANTHGEPLYFSLIIFKVLEAFISFEYLP